MNLRARTEIDEVMGARPNVTYEDLTKLEYIGCVFKETLRKWPVAAEFSRISTHDVELSGLHVPKNTLLLVF